MPLRLATNVAETSALSPAGLVLFHRCKLHRVLEIAEAMAELALAAAQRNAHDGVPNPTAAPSAALDRIARCMRRTVLLDRMLDEPIRTRRAAPAERVVDGKVAMPPARSDADQPKAERADREWPERLDRPDFLIDLTKTTPDDVIADIERDLGMDDLATLDGFEAYHAGIARDAKTTRRPPDPQPRPKDEKPPRDKKNPPPPRRDPPKCGGDPSLYWSGAGGNHGPPG